VSEIERKILCVCGQIIETPSDYMLVFVKKEMMEVDILCPNPSCFLKELGYVKFKVEEGKVSFEKAAFYSPFVTWNVARLGREFAIKTLKEHLREIVKKRIEWDRIEKELAT